VEAAPNGRTDGLTDCAVGARAARSPASRPGGLPSPDKEAEFAHGRGWQAGARAAHTCAHRESYGPEGRRKSGRALASGQKAMPNLGNRRTEGQAPSRRNQRICEYGGMGEYVIVGSGIELVHELEITQRQLLSK